MSTYYTLYTEAKIGGTWHCIDFYQKTPGGSLGLIPIISGQSALGGVLRWEGLLGQKINHSELSEGVREAYKTERPEDQTWAFFDFWSEFGSREFKAEEHIGYAPVDRIAAFENGEEEALVVAVNEGEFLSPAEFSSLTPEAQKGFRYYEWTEPYGYFDTMRRIKRGVTERINAYENELWWSAGSADTPSIDGPVRVLINIS